MDERKKLTRSRYDKVFFGVCGGLAKYLDVDTTIVRILFAVVSLTILPFPIILYFVMAFIMPLDEY